MDDSNTSPFWLQVPDPYDLVKQFGTAVDVPAYMGIMGRIVESGRRRIIHLTSTHAESELIQKALSTVAAFFR